MLSIEENSTKYDEREVEERCLESWAIMNQCRHTYAEPRTIRTRVVREHKLHVTQNGTIPRFDLCPVDSLAAEQLIQTFLRSTLYDSSSENMVLWVIGMTRLHLTAYGVMLIVYCSRMDCRHRTA